jgi:hypothetical protein
LENYVLSRAFSNKGVVDRVENVGLDLLKIDREIIRVVYTGHFVRISTGGKAHPSRT